MSRRRKQPWTCQWAATSTGWPKSSAKSAPKAIPSRRNCRFWGATSPNYPSSIRKPIRNSTCSSSIASPNSETAGAASGMSRTSTSVRPGRNLPSWVKNTKMSKSTGKNLTRKWLFWNRQLAWSDLVNILCFKAFSELPDIKLLLWCIEREGKENRRWKARAMDFWSTGNWGSFTRIKQVNNHFHKVKAEGNVRKCKLLPSVFYFILPVSVTLDDPCFLACFCKIQMAAEWIPPTFYDSNFGLIYKELLYNEWTIPKKLSRVSPSIMLNWSKNSKRSSSTPTEPRQKTLTPTRPSGGNSSRKLSKLCTILCSNDWIFHLFPLFSYHCNSSACLPAF